MLKKLEIVRRIPFFSDLSENDLLEISQKFSEKEFKKGEYLFWEGEPASYLYVIKSGKVKVLKRSAGGKEIVLEVVTPGEICGRGRYSLRTNMPQPELRKSQEFTLFQSGIYYPCSKPRKA
jgi:CRP-like cAMP-binding protein